MILSMHLADLGVRAAVGSLARPLKRDRVAGLRYAVVTITAPLGAQLLPAPRLRRVGLVAAWDDDDALDGFLRTHPLARRLEPGWQVRLEPLHAFGSWPALPELENLDNETADDEPVAVLTLGRPRPSQFLRFLRASARAEELAVADPAVLAATGIARPPTLVATFSIWRTAAAMRDYAQGRSGEGHLAASRAHKAKPFHYESAFFRFRPYRSQGSWDGRDPLAEVARDLTASPRGA